MNIIIIGCGQVGIRIASSLCRLGHDVAMLSQDDTKLDDLPADFSGLKVMGVPMDTDVLESAGIKECDA
ncbi:MAG: NAD-binding protein, partial [Oscillospiraceae bacterium]